MALANFFDRALLSAAQALKGADLNAIEERLNAQVVELVFDDAAATSAEGQAMLDLSVRLLARLYPILKIRALGSDTGLSAKLTALARAINPAIEFTARGRSTVRLVVGDAKPSGKTSTIYIGSDSWLAKVATKGPQGVGASSLVFGAGGAACLGAANVFRCVFEDALTAGGLDEESVLSLFDFSTGVKAQQGPAEVAVDLSGVPIAGLGAIGNGLVWALGRSKGVVGAPHLIDHEKIELSNLQRYVLATQADVGRVKVEVARQHLVTEESLEPLLFSTRWESYVVGCDYRPMARAVAALDSARDRIAVQAALPARALNAWTQSGDLGVSRHDFDGSHACLACLYVPSEATLNEDQLIARALKLPEEIPTLHRLRDLLILGGPVGAAFARETAERLGLAHDALLQFANEPLRQFYVKAVCGQAQFLIGQTQTAIEAPLAFQSALAGVLLAAELVCDAGALRLAPLATKTVIDVLRPLKTYLNIAVSKRPAGNPSPCICQDDDFKTAFAARHEAHGTEDGRRHQRR